VQQKTDLRSLKLQARAQHHSIGVRERVKDGVRTFIGQLAEPCAPPLVGLDRDHDVGVGSADQSQEAVGPTVLHEHVDDEQRE
jgi:hypothetical protein